MDITIKTEKGTTITISGTDLSELNKFAKIIQKAIDSTTNSKWFNGNRYVVDKYIIKEPNHYRVNININGKLTSKKFATLEEARVYRDEVLKAYPRKEYNKNYTR